MVRDMSRAPGLVCSPGFGYWPLQPLARRGLSWPGLYPKAVLAAKMPRIKIARAAKRAGSQTAPTHTHQLGTWQPV